MLKISGNQIGLTRGDSAYIGVNIVELDGTEYEMKSGDKLTFSARKEIGESVLMSVESTSKTIHILPSDSRKLIVGKGFFDVQLTSGEDIFTIVGPESPSLPNLTVYPEVTTEV